MRLTGVAGGLNRRLYHGHDASHPHRPATGLKLFNTRAAKAEKIAGKGYSAIDDVALEDLRTAPGANSTPRSRPSIAPTRRGVAPPTTWRWKASSALSRRRVYSEPPIPREALEDETEVLVIGAGFGALLWYS